MCINVYGPKEIMPTVKLDVMGSERLVAVMVPTTLSAVLRLVVPMPTLPFVVSTLSTLVVPSAFVKLKAVVVSADGVNVVEPEELVEAFHS